MLSRLRFCRLFEEAVSRVRLAMLHTNKAKTPNVCASHCELLAEVDTLLSSSIDDLGKARPTGKNLKKNIDIAFEHLKSVHHDRRSKQ